MHDQSSILPLCSRCKVTRLDKWNSYRYCKPCDAARKREARAAGKVTPPAACYTCQAVNDTIGTDGRCRDCRRNYMRTLREAHPEKTSTPERLRYRALRAEVLAAYGGQCVCCAEAAVEFLALDHVAGDGGAHRMQVRRDIYRWAKDNGFPATLQILCHNCNTAIGHYGICPHGTLPARPVKTRGPDITRVARGERQGLATLSADQVREIRRRYAAGETQQELAAAFKMHQTAISAIIRRKTWKHLE